MMKRLASTLLVAATLAACGGGGGGGNSSLPATQNTATPSPSPTSTQTAPAPSPSSTANAATTLQLTVLTNYSPGSPITQPSPGSVGENNIVLNYTALGQTQYVLVFEPGFTGNFKFNVSGCTTPDVSLSPSAPAAGPEVVLAITASAAGACAVQITDGTTVNTAALATVVTTTTGTISTKHRE